MTKGKLLLLLVGYCLLTATTPGAIGSCGADDLAKSADFAPYCQEREELVCTRRFLRKEITAETRDSCRWDAVDACERRAFPPDCRPTRRETEACLRALSSFDTLDTPDDQLKECAQKELCTATPSETADAAASGGASGRGDESP